jgi:hypothetical protein
METSRDWLARVLAKYEQEALVGTGNGRLFQTPI